MSLVRLATDRRKTAFPAENAGWVRAWCATAGLALFAVLAWVKFDALRYNARTGDPNLSGGLRFSREWLLALPEDALVVLAVCLAAGLALRAARGRAWLSWCVSAGMRTLFAVLAVYAVADLRLWHGFGYWLTYPLYCHSGGLAELDPGVQASMPPEWLAKLAAVGCGLVAAHAAFLRLGGARGRQLCSRVVRPLPITALATALVAACLINPHPEWQQRRSPFVVFAVSYFRHTRGIGGELALDAHWQNDFGPAVADDRPTQMPTTELRRSPRKLNVVVVVLESVGAQFLHLYGAPWANTPTLERLAEQGLVFTNFFAHASITAESIVAINSSVHPRTDTRLTTWETPDLAVPDLPQVLSKQGYRTALVSQTFRGRGIRDYTDRRHYDFIADASDMGYGYDTFDDRRLAQDGLRWIDSQRGKPFLLMLWTYQTHWPFYAAEPVEELAPGRERLNRFLAATRAADDLLADLVAGLKRRGLWDSTLLVVTGDHGQAFNPGDDLPGGRDLTDYTLQVPLLIAAPALFSEHRDCDVVGQHADLAPTIVDLLGLPAPREWQGRSLFAAGRPPRAYFIDKFGVQPVYGLREGNYKFFVGCKGRELYDCRSDPQLLHNCAREHPELSERLYKQLVAWYRFQFAYLDQYRTARR